MSRAKVCGAQALTVKLGNFMNLGKLGQALSAREIFDLIQDDLVRVEKKLSVESVASVDAVTAIGQYLQSSGGKRLRPALLLLASKFAGDGGQSAIRLGAVVELIHAATLVHDDVIDALRAIGHRTHHGRLPASGSDIAETELQHALQLAHG